MKKIDAVIKVLKREFPNPSVELHYSTPLELLMATILSAQCTDDRVNKVTPTLFRKYRTAGDYARADAGVLEQEIRSTGFYRNKAKNIISCCGMLVEKHGGEVPGTLEDLVSLPGVWRKTANVILGNCFGRPAIVVDTHVRRVSQRIGLARSDDPDRIEEELGAVCPRRLWTRLSHQLLLHGRYICRAKDPQCSVCGLSRICDYFSEGLKGTTK